LDVKGVGLKHKTTQEYALSTKCNEVDDGTERPS
jgi:hypothetical protein